MQMLLPGVDEVSESLAAASSLHFVKLSINNAAQILSVPAALTSAENRLCTASHLLCVDRNCEQNKHMYVFFFF